MTLPYFPKPGEVLVCNFDSGFRPPEMVKVRPVIVVSRKDSHSRRLCTVVPISTTPPQNPMPWHIPLPHVRVPSFPHTTEQWAKCDMLSTVSFDRLCKPYRSTMRSGRQFIGVFLHDEDLVAVRAAITSYLTLA